MHLLVDGGAVRQVESLRYLGVCWDELGSLSEFWSERCRRAKSAAYSSFFAWGRRVTRAQWFRAWRSLGESQVSWCWGGVGPKTAASAMEMERMEAHAVRLATGADWTVPYCELLERLQLQPIVIRSLAASLTFVYRCWAGLRPSPWAQTPLALPDPVGPPVERRRNPPRAARPPEPEQSAAEAESSWERHGMQLRVPCCPLERVCGSKALPFLRSLRVWNCLVMTKEEEARLLEGTLASAGWFKRHAVDFIQASAPRIRILFPSFPLDAATRLS